MATTNPTLSNAPTKKTNLQIIIEDCLQRIPPRETAFTSYAKSLLTSDDDTVTICAKLWLLLLTPRSLPEVKKSKWAFPFDDFLIGTLQRVFVEGGFTFDENIDLVAPVDLKKSSSSTASVSKVSSPTTSPSASLENIAESVDEIEPVAGEKTPNGASKETLQHASKESVTAKEESKVTHQQIFIVNETLLQIAKHFDARNAAAPVELKLIQFLQFGALSSTAVFSTPHLEFVLHKLCEVYCHSKHVVNANAARVTLSQILIERITLVDSTSGDAGKILMFIVDFNVLFVFSSMLSMAVSIVE